MNVNIGSPDTIYRYTNYIHSDYNAMLVFKLKP